MLLLVVCVAAIANGVQWLSAEKEPFGVEAFVIPTAVETVLNNRCVVCHNAEAQEGDIRLDNIADLSRDDRLDLLNKAQTQIFFESMPPKDEEQPTAAGRAKLATWVSAELNKYNASKLDDKLRLPGYGNYVDHEKLFSGEYIAEMGFTVDRRWLISEFIFNDKINRLLDYEPTRTIDGQRMTVIGDNGVNIGTRFGGGSLRQSITNPFLLPTNIGVRYYDNTMLAGGHLLTMISNARKIAGYMASEETMKAHYPAMYRIMKLELDHLETLQLREEFLNLHIPRTTRDIYQERDQKLLPQFVRIAVEEVPVYGIDGDGNEKKRTNLELLRTRYGDDLQAVYRGIATYSGEGITFEQIIEKCEREWSPLECTRNVLGRE